MRRAARDPIVPILHLALAAVVGLAAWALLRGTAARAAEPAFELPIACDPGRDCFIQNYVDLDPGPGRRDWACGRLTYDGHDGTDFRVPDHPAMVRGVAVLAAAPGVVRAVRDGMADVHMREAVPPVPDTQAAGNVVVVEHGGGWRTVYAHLKRGSVRVAPGDRVDAGQPVGEVGLSGWTEFPHVHFEIMHQGRSVDPFVGTLPVAGCDAPRRPLWSAAAAERIGGYRATGALAAGFAPVRADAEAARRGAYAGPIPRDAEVLVFWADLFGVGEGDEQHAVLTGSDGRPLAEQREILKDSRVSWFYLIGRRAPPAGWPAGTYEGTLTLRRNGAVVTTIARTIELR